MDVRKCMAELDIADEPDASTVRASPGHRGRNRVVFLDRDGVLNEEELHLHRKEDLRMVKGVPEALTLLRRMGYLLVVVTNQGGIGKGLFTVEDFLEVMTAIREELAKEKPWDRTYFCPFADDGTVPRYTGWHQDRKPNPGMLLRAAYELDIDVPSSIMIGDHVKDVQAAHRAGCKGVLVMTGHGKVELKGLVDAEVLPGDERWPDLIAQDLLTACRAIDEGLV
ncbi:MAG: HAD family hydrolase [Candidatus Thermoplasmatota archaeon]|jgi:D-glycero-D-manno-heptose 1,7-bisphosphate phosphatase|nr:HAD family hydrolase [Candidatus Thermoplasmatota archaeon]